MIMITRTLFLHGNGIELTMKHSLTRVPMNRIRIFSFLLVLVFLSNAGTLLGQDQAEAETAQNQEQVAAEPGGDSQWRHYFTFIFRRGTLSMFEKGEDQWVSQLTGGEVMGYSYRKEMDYFWADWGAAWDLSLNYRILGGGRQTIVGPEGDQYSPGGNTVHMDNALGSNHFEALPRILLVMLGNPKGDYAGPFFGAGYSFNQFVGGAYIMRGSSISEECEQSVAAEDAELITAHCERKDFNEHVFIPTSRIGLTAMLGDFHWVIARQPAVRFQVGDYEFRYETRLMFGFEYRF